MLSREVATKTAFKPAVKPAPPHLWANDPEVAKVRKALLIYFIRTSIVFWILILLVALIFLGSGVNPIWHTNRLDVFITNFDNGSAGDFFVQAFHETPSGNQTLNWIFQDPADIPTSIVQQIEDGKAWASVYMNPGTTDRLNQILQTVAKGNITGFSYNPALAVTIVYDQGRNLNTVNGYVLPPVRAAIAVASSLYNKYLESLAAELPNVTLSNVVAATSIANIITSPIGSTDKNIHPATPFAAFLATTLGYLFLWLITISLVGMGVRITQPMAGKVKIIDIVCIRICNTIINGLMISLIYSLTILWFASFTRAGPFIRFWLFNWLAVITFTVIISFFIINLGQIAQAIIILFLILNLSTATTNVTLELQNKFYYVGYGLPLFHCFSGGRHLLFGSHSRLNVDIAVLFAYFFTCIFLSFLTAVVRMRAQNKKLEEENRKKAAKKKKTFYYTTQNITTKKK